MSLNITSLMDILTIVLIFLIISFSSQENEISPPKDFQLPSSSSERAVKLAVKVSLSQSEIRVEEKIVATLAGGKLRRSQLDSQQNVEPLLRELRKHKARLRAGTRVEPVGEDDETEIVYFEAEKGLPYEIIDRVLKTAATAGFAKFRLAVHRSM